MIAIVLRSYPEREKVGMLRFLQHNIHRRVELIGLVLCLLVLPTAWNGSPAAAHDLEAQHILILHTHQPGQSWTDSITAAMEKTLNQSNAVLNIHVEYLDARRYTEPDYLELLRNDLRSCNQQGHPFDLVLLSDSNALAFALAHRHELLNDSPIVFSGIRGIDTAAVESLDRVTGIVETLAFRETLDMALKLHPETKRVIFVGQPRSEADRANQRALHEVVANYPDLIRFDFWDSQPLEEITRRMQGLSRGTLVFINGTLLDHSGHQVPYPADIRHLRKACRVPLYSFRDLYLNHGIVGGKLTSAALQGQLAAELALKILDGEDPETLPITHAGDTVWRFDNRQLERFGIDRDQLPDESEIINQPPPPYTLSKKQLWIILAVMAFFTLDLLFILYQRRKAEQAHKDSIARFRLLLNSAAEGIYGLDMHGKCSFLNPAALRLLGYEEETKLIGRDLHALIHHTRADGTPYAAEDCKICHAYQQRSRIHLEDEVFWRKDGTSFPVEYWSYPLVRGSQTIGAVVSFLDISERKEAEGRLKEANRELDAFVYTASHDLRTPLSVISGYTDLLQSEYGDTLDENANEYLQTIEKHGVKMAALIDDLLALAKAGNIEPPTQPVDTDAIVADVLLGFENQICAGGIKVDVQPLPHVMVPESLLAEVFENLIGNALRYAVADGGKIEVSGERRNGVTRFQVRDNGPGIPVEEAARVFEVFYRGSTGKKVLGSGVGLATVQKIARLYGGQAWVERTPGGGATFLVEIQDQLPGA